MPDSPLTRYLLNPAIARLGLLSHGIIASWRASTLARQFLIGATAVLLPAMIIAGTWVTRLIHDGVVRNTSQSAALYLENFVEPLLQNLAASETLSDSERLQLDRLPLDSSIGQRVVSIKVWGNGGRVVYSSRPGITGRVFPVGPKQQAAWQGQVAAELSNLAADENVTERVLAMPLMEIYFPVRQRGTDRIIAVAEFYENATNLANELSLARLKSWSMIALVTTTLLAALFGIVRQGSRTITQQKLALETRVDELTRLLQENASLRARLQQASARASENHEFFLRRLGADIHDGPAQLISAALLRFDDARSADSRDRDGKSPKQTVRGIMEDALKGLRNLAAGLSVPEIETLPLCEALSLAVRKHEEITGTRVQQDLRPLPGWIPASIKLCAYRFAQEGLTNAWRHADGKAQRLRSYLSNDDLVLEVHDSGKGFEWANGGKTGRLGVRGLADRIESLGGTFIIDSVPGRGTVLTARLPLEGYSDANI
jgi:signal transduction histidine kinase